MAFFISWTTPCTALATHNCVSGAVFLFFFFFGLNFGQTLSDGLGLMANDWATVLIAFVFHISINVFNFFVEEPFVKKTYHGSGANIGSTSLFDDEIETHA